VALSLRRRRAAERVWLLWRGAYDEAAEAVEAVEACVAAEEDRARDRDSDRAGAGMAPSGGVWYTTGVDGVRVGVGAALVARGADGAALWV